MTTLSAIDLNYKMADQTLCRHLNFTACPNQRWAILGRNGIGKSSLLHVLAGITAPTQGHILLDNQSLSTLSRKQIASTIAILFQDNPINLPCTVYATLANARLPFLSRFGKISAYDQQLIDDLLAAFDLTILHDRYLQHLSGGERQRVYLASILAQTPQVLLLDEPTNHLDLKYQHWIMQTLQQLTLEHKTVIMTLQDINLAAQYCSHAILMYNADHMLCGKISDLFTPENLSALYQQPMTVINTTDRQYWVAN